MLLKVGGMPWYFEKIAKKETEEVYKKWLKTVRNNDKELRKLFDFYCTELYALIFDNKGRIIMPRSKKHTDAPR